MKTPNPIKILVDVDQSFLNKIQSLFKAENGEGFFWFKEDQNGDVVMSDIMKANIYLNDANGKAPSEEGYIETLQFQDDVYIINYDKPVGRFNNAEPEVQGNAVSVLETGKYIGVITNPAAHSLITTSDRIKRPE